MLLNYQFLLNIKNQHPASQLSKNFFDYLILSATYCYMFPQTSYTSHLGIGFSACSRASHLHNNKLHMKNNFISFCIAIQDNDNQSKFCCSCCFLFNPTTSYHVQFPFGLKLTPQPHSYLHPWIILLQRTRVRRNEETLKSFTPWIRVHISWQVDMPNSLVRSFHLRGILLHAKLLWNTSAGHVHWIIMLVAQHCVQHRVW